MAEEAVREEKENTQNIVNKLLSNKPPSIRFATVYNSLQQFSTVYNIAKHIFFQSQRPPIFKSRVTYI